MPKLNGRQPQDYPQIDLKDFFEEVMQHHLDVATPKSVDEFMRNPALQEKIIELIKGSQEVSKAVLGMSAMSGIKPPEVSTIVHMGIIIGVGLVLELLNEKEGPLN